jgi:hypothetical protein
MRATSRPESVPRSMVPSTSANRTISSAQGLFSAPDRSRRAGLS